MQALEKTQAGETVHARQLPGWSPKVLLRDAGIGLALLLLILFFSVSTEHFLTANNISNILTQITINLILAVGMTFVILIGGIDLSVGSMLAFCAVVGGTVLTIPDLSVFQAVALATLAAVGTGVVCGFLNGWI